MLTYDTTANYTLTVTETLAGLRVQVPNQWLDRIFVPTQDRHFRCVHELILIAIGKEMRFPRLCVRGADRSWCQCISHFEQRRQSPLNVGFAMLLNRCFGGNANVTDCTGACSSSSPGGWRSSCCTDGGGGSAAFESAGPVPQPCCHQHRLKEQPLWLEEAAALVLVG